LSDRIATACSIMHRAVRRGADLPPAVVARGFADADREMGYLLRGAEPGTAVKWYLRALRHPAGRLETLKGLAGLAAGWVRGKRSPVAAENATENV
jgi:hypothetical protein